jgi:hypothetical protein
VLLALELLLDVLLLALELLLATLVVVVLADVLVGAPPVPVTPSPERALHAETRRYAIGAPRMKAIVRQLVIDAQPPKLGSGRRSVASP